MVPRTTGEWLRALLSCAWFRGRRRDSAQRLRVLVQTLARHADWTHHTAWPTWERLIDATGWARSTMSSWLAQLQNWLNTSSVTIEIQT